MKISFKDKLKENKRPDASKLGYENENLNSVTAN